MGKEIRDPGVIQEVLGDLPGQLSVEGAEESRDEVRGEIRKYDGKIEKVREDLMNKFPQREKAKTLQKEHDDAIAEQKLIKARGGDDNPSEADRQRIGWY